jgi:hypothetical protein
VYYLLPGLWFRKKLIAVNSWSLQGFPKGFWWDQLKASWFDYNNEIELSGLPDP